jgi:protein-disulfide isomerase
MFIALVTLVIIGFGITGYSININAEDKASDTKEAGSATFTSEQKAEIEKMFKSLLAESGGEIMDAVTKYQADQAKVDEEKSKLMLTENEEAIFNDPDTPIAGNPNGDVTVVEFFDYNCGYCKKALPDITAILKDPNVKVAFKEMPILSPASGMAAKWALAADKQGKYWEFHSKLMETKDNKTEEKLTEIANNIGIDVEQLKKDAADPALDKLLEANQKLARELSVRGTPAFIIGDKIFRGYIGQDAMKAAVAEARSGK